MREITSGLARLGIVLGLGAAVASSPGLAQQDDEALIPLLRPDVLERQTLRGDDEIGRLVRGWPDYQGDQSGDRGFQDKRILKRKQVTFLGKSARGEYRRFVDGGHFELLFVVLEFRSTYCDEALDRLKSSFGRPRMENHLRVGPAGSVLRELESEWVFNLTRVRFSCSDASRKDGFAPLFATLWYGNAEESDALMAVEQLSCDYRQDYVGALSNRDPKIGVSIALTVDPNRGSIYDESYFELLKISTYSPERIRAGMTSERRTSAFLLDRATGRFSWKIRLSDDPATGADATGLCRSAKADQ